DEARSGEPLEQPRAEGPAPHRKQELRHGFGAGKHARAESPRHDDHLVPPAARRPLDHRETLPRWGKRSGRKVRDVNDIRTVAVFRIAITRFVQYDCNSWIR